jgi:hypothetical protein
MLGELSGILQAAFSDAPAEMRYRFFAAVIPNITDEKPTPAALKTETLKGRRGTPRRK